MDWLAYPSSKPNVSIGICLAAFLTVAAWECYRPLKSGVNEKDRVFFIRQVPGAGMPNRQPQPGRAILRPRRVRQEFSGRR